MSASRIVSATIRPMPVKLGDPMPKVAVTLDDGTQADLFWYYPDEISFNEAELVGFTCEEARALRRQKDVAYLRSQEAK
jgi:hypothetical protein